MLIFNSPWLLIGDLITEISKWQISFILFYILPSWCRIEFQLWFIRSEVLKVLFTIKALEPDVSPVCLICSTTSESGQVDEVAKLAKSGLFGLLCLYKVPELAQFPPKYLQHFHSKLLFPWLSHVYVSVSAKGECCFVFVAEFQKFLERRPTHTFHLTALCTVFVHSVHPAIHTVLNYNCH